MRGGHPGPLLLELAADSVAHVTRRVEGRALCEDEVVSEQRTALVLGGGGITGIAWEIGVIAGLAEAGVDLTTAHLVVGTSAGSVVGAQITSGAELEAMYQRQLALPTNEQAARMTRAALARYAWAMVRSRGRDVEFRRRVGALALAAEKAGLTPPEQERLDVIGSRLVSAEWPGRALVVTAVDLARGYDRLVVLAPIPRGAGPMASVDAQVTGMVARVAVVSPDRESRVAIGRNVLDPAARAPSARAGRAQAKQVVDRVAEAWTA
jgi:NTE family protein